MAGPDRTQAHDLIDWPALAADLQRAGLFATLRRAEAGAPGKPRLGTARRPEHSIVDLAQEPSLGFAAMTLAALETRHGRPRLYGHWLGLLGPMGPLPTHMSEFAFYERKYAKERPFGDWLDLLAGRMLQLFYRAWAESQPAAQADRPGEDRFARWVGALCGVLECLWGKVLGQTQDPQRNAQSLFGGLAPMQLLAEHLGGGRPDGERTLHDSLVG